VGCHENIDSDDIVRFLESQLANELEGEPGIPDGGSGNQAAFGLISDEIGEFSGVVAEPCERAWRIILGPAAECRGNDLLALAASRPDHDESTGGGLPPTHWLTMGNAGPSPPRSS